ncbi:thaumatin-like protein 1 [Tanacetum coccineum]
MHQLDFLIMDHASPKGVWRPGQDDAIELEPGPLATLAEFTYGSESGTQDFYDVSLVDGYNIQMIVEASGGSGDYATTMCVDDLNTRCPSELRVADGGGCKSLCEMSRL